MANAIGALHKTLMRISPILIVLALAACSPAPPPAAPQAPVVQAEAKALPPPGEGQSFQAPSGNLGCNFVPDGGTAIYESPDGGAELQCDRVEPTYVRFALSAHGGPTLIENVGDAGCCGGDTMPYGTLWRAGPFTCDVAEAGLTCTNADGRGFILSRTQAAAR